MLSKLLKVSGADASGLPASGDHGKSTCPSGTSRGFALVIIAVATVGLGRKYTFLMFPHGGVSAGDHAADAGLSGADPSTRCAACWARWPSPTRANAALRRSAPPPPRPPVEPHVRTPALRGAEHRGV